MGNFHGAFVGRPKRKPIANKAGQLAIDASFEDVPMEMQDTRLATGNEGYPTLGDGENTRYIQAIVETHKIAQNADMNDISTLYNCLEQYIDMCKRLDIRVTNMGAYQACGLSRKVVCEWAAGVKRKNDPEYARFAQLIRSICSEYREMLMVDNKISPITGIWWQKNYDHLVDNPTPFDEIADGREDLTSAEIAEKYRDIPDE